MDNHRNASSRSTAITVIMALVFALTIVMSLSFVLDLQAASNQSGAARIHPGSAARV